MHTEDRKISIYMKRSITRKEAVKQRKSNISSFQTKWTSFINASIQKFLIDKMDSVIPGQEKAVSSKNY